MELDKLATKMSGCPPGSREYLACYRVAVSTVEKGLTDELRIKYKADAQKWMDEKPPPAVQRRYVHAKHSELWGLNLTNKDAREVPRTRSSRIRRVHVLSIRDADSYIGWIPGSPRGRCGHIVCVTFYLIMCITNHEIAMTSMTSSEEPPSKPLMTGRIPAWYKRLASGLPSRLVRHYFALWRNTLIR